MTVQAALVQAMLQPETASSRLKEALRLEIAKAHPDWAEVNEVAADIAEDSAANLLKDLSESKKRMVAVLVAKGIDNGWDDQTLADRIAQVVGLDARYANAVENQRLALVKQGMPKGRARQVSRDYAKRLRSHRAMVIARNEVHRALCEAQRRLWTQMQQAGDLSAYAVRVTVTHKDERLCVVCRPQGGKRASLKAGTKGGPPFHPQCRCYEVLEDQGVVKMEPLTKPGRTGQCVKCDALDHETSEHDDMVSKGKGRLDWSPKKNWVEDAGGLPKYIEDIALALIRDHGMSRERAIPVAINRCKLWAAGGGDVKADTRAKAAKAVAQWEAMKAKARGK